MFCSSCGQQLHSDVSFCSKCGSKVGEQPKTTQQAVVDWEYKDFVYVFQPKQLVIQADNLTDIGIRAEIWQRSQSVLNSELQKWIDTGWKPVSEVGSSGISFKKYWRSLWDQMESCGGLIVFLVLCLIFLFLPVLIVVINGNDFAEAIEFRVKMRRM